MDRKRVFLIILVPVVLTVLAVGYIYAQGPELPPLPQVGVGGQPQAPLGGGFTYQGQLKDSGGNPIGDTCDFGFSLWDAPITGTQVGGDSVVTGVAVTNGYFAALVNGKSEFGDSAFAGEERWLEIAVRCTADPTPVTLEPRQRLSAAPYALYALAVAPHDHWGQSWSGSGTGLTLSGGDIGLSGSGATYGVYGFASAVSGVNYGVRGESASSNGTGVIGSAPAVGVTGRAMATSGGGTGVSGVTFSIDGIGVWGLAGATSGTTYGVYGLNVSTEGHGVYGSSNATSGAAYGVYGQSASTDGAGVAGWATATSGPTRGVTGRSESPAGYGVFGIAGATSGTTYGVYGQSDSNYGYGVYGCTPITASGAIAYGVYGESGAAWGSGVWGRSRFLGVLGHGTDTSGHSTGVSGATASPVGAGVYGQAVHSAADYGVYSYGNFAATGTKSAIVWTRDYGWRHLYAMESPDVLFEDVGTAQLLGGQAIVPLDPVFAQTVDLQQPYQVFLTPLGDCGLYVAGQTDTSFTVRALDGRSCTIAFHYRLIARRLGYEDTRLVPAANPDTMARPFGPTPLQEVWP